ncbi:hypothetical protein IGI37_002253 [Enterococcus sp. AZ194]|uniref:SGNH/GDSL hydrolase family protein n=1 Tax=Enterococcus sp. AZ194 TaxID=2774629 RepID=UPI003F1F96EF
MPITPVSGEIKAQPLNDNFSYLDSKIEQIKGGPLGVLESESELNQKYPNGANGFFIIDGNMWIWENDKWTNAGVYQAIGLADESVTYPKIAGQLNYIESCEITENKYMQSVASDGTITYTDTANYFLATLDIPKSGKLAILKSSLQHGQSLAVIDSVGKAAAYWAFGFGNMFNAAWATNYTAYYVIDATLLKQAYPTATQLVIEFRIEDRQSAYIYGHDTADLTDKDWGAGPEFGAIRNVPNRLSDRYDLLKEPTSVTYPNKSIPRYNSSTGLVELSPVSNRTSYYFDITEMGTLEFPVYTLPDQQFLMLVDKDKKVLKNFDYTFNTGTSTIDFLQKSNGLFTIDIDKLKAYNANVKGLYVVVWNKAVDGFYIAAKNAFLVTDVFPSLTDLNQKKEIVLPTEYPIVEGRTGYIYLDNVNLYGNYYTDKDLYISQTDNNDLIAGGFPITPTADKKIPISRMENGLEIERKSILVKSIPAAAGSGKMLKALFIGESTTEAQAYLNALIACFNNDPLSIVLGGTRGSGETKHEGRSGWTTNHLMTSESYNGATNSFYNPTTKKFDYSYYLKTFNIDIPDIVFLSFGINDPNQGIAASKTIANLKNIISQIRAVNPNVKFGIGLTSNLCRIENVAYRTEIRRNNILKTTQALIKEFDNKKSQGYYLNPMYLNVDPIWDMRYTERQLSIYQTKTELYSTDGTHPADATGYKKTADATYFTIKWMAT